MENQVRKKKKEEVHKVSVDLQKHENSRYEVKSVPNAFFPFEPYPEQISLISKVNDAIQKCENVLIESPTGTGKTLCMLVGSLSSVCSLSQLQNPKVPKIYYLTRTHSQITQVLKEMKRIPWYDCRVNIIASRDQLCINRNLKELKGRMLDRGCQEMCRQKMCKFKEEMPQSIAHLLREWLTVEELREKGNKKNFCPFYFSKMVTEKSEVTIMPFNYLLDWMLFEHNSFNLKNAVLIFDEAHNVDSLAEEGSSLEIDTDTLTQAFHQLKNLQQSSKCRYLHKKFENELDESTTSVCINQAKNLISKMNYKLKEFTNEKNYNRIDDLMVVLKEMTNFVNEGEEFYGIDLNNYEDILYNLEKIRKLFTQKKIISEHFDLFLTTFTRMMKLVDSTEMSNEDYYLHVGPKSSKKSYALKVNCLNAAFTFQRLVQQKPRSMIFCSGTLGPFEVWQRELGMVFSKKINVPSFITEHQICVNVVMGSYDCEMKYEFSYQNRNREEQFQKLGEQLKRIEEIVPNGIVVAFSTYELMQKTMKYCLGLQKSVYFQSKTQNVDQIYLRYGETAKTQKGAFLFIVMKGKFSEGINFNDELCRCLIVVGIPFLPPNDFKVKKKKQYIRQKFGSSAPQQWYYSQSFKSVNQVIGRVIRSKKDYGCILLVDQRYGRKDIIKELPSWFTTNLPDLLSSGCTYLERMKEFFSKELWKKQIEETKKKNINEGSSFEFMLSKTIKGGDQEDSLSIEKLLNQETPVKPKKTRKTLTIVSDDEQVDERDKDTHKDTHIKSGKMKKSGYYKKKSIPFEKIQNRNNEPQKIPWLSIDYFMGNQQYQVKCLSSSTCIISKELLNSNEAKDEKNALISIQSSPPRNRNYL